ncbi:hypothetical protein [Clostridium tertium]|uniref:hypothetical protein n=1 Tax=Clostridium tertium TaxID=1559 RepID=UPI0018AC6C11|nr:hypothetical protein [Clostridium tertium]
MEKYIDLEINYKSKLLKLLEDISRIKVTDEEGNTRIVYVKEGINQHMEGINDKVTS